MNQVSAPFVRAENHGAGLKFPNFDMPNQGWPCVVVVDHQARGQRTATAALVQEALTRWGMASIDGIGRSNQSPAVTNIDLPLINARRHGVVELSSQGVKLVALIDGTQQHAFMDIDPSSAPDEVAMWFVEHLWVGQTS